MLPFKFRVEHSQTPTYQVKNAVIRRVTLERVHPLNTLVDPMPRGSPNCLDEASPFMGPSCWRFRLHTVYAKRTLAMRSKYPKCNLSKVTHPFKKAPHRHGYLRK